MAKIERKRASIIMGGRVQIFGETDFPWITRAVHLPSDSMLIAFLLVTSAAAAWDPAARLLNTPRHLKARMAAATRRGSSSSASCSGAAGAAGGGGLRATPTTYGGDPTGTVDSTAAVQSALQFCINASIHIPGKVRLASTFILVRVTSLYPKCWTSLSS